MSTMKLYHRLNRNKDNAKMNSFRIVFSGQRNVTITRVKVIHSPFRLTTIAFLRSARTSGHVRWGQVPSCVLHMIHVGGTVRKLVYMKRICPNSAWYNSIL